MGLEELERALAVGTEHDVIELGGSVPEKSVSEIELHLGVRFPPSYREFVRRVGFCSILSREFYGITKSGLFASAIPSVVFATKSEREAGGLPQELLVIEESGGDETFVIDTRATRADGEAPVRVWTPAFRDSPDLTAVAADFGEYLLDAVEAALT